MTGYKDPPQEHRWKPGGPSPNPGGRPRKTRSQLGTSGSIDLADVIMHEVYRPIEIRENGKAEEMPMIQAIIRRLNVAGAQGNLAAAKTVLSFVQAIEQKRFDDKVALFDAMRAYKISWQETFAECDRAGRPRPDPVPHPDDVIIDSRDGTVKFNGPINAHHKDLWDVAQLRKSACEHELAALKKEMRKRGVTSERRAAFEACVQDVQAEFNKFEAMFPPEKVRRAKGFDLERYRRLKATIYGLDYDELMKTG